MKQILLILLFFLFNLLSYSQSNITFNKMTLYINDSPLDGYEYVRAVEQIDSNYFFNISLYNDTVFVHQILVKTDLYGNMINYYYFGGKFNYERHSLIKDDTNLIFVANNRINGNNQSHGFVAKLNNNLDTIWTKTYQLEDSLVGPNCDTAVSYNLGVFKAVDGNYLIYGRYYENCINKPREFIRKIDKNGNTLWLKLYTDIYEAKDLVPLQDSGFVIINFLPSSPFKIHRFDKYGNQIWEKQMSDTIQWPNGLSIFANNGALALSNDTNILVSSPYIYDINQQNSVYKSGVFIAKLNMNTGNILWSKFHIPYPFFRSDFPLNQCHSLTALKDNRILLSGTFSVEKGKRYYKGAVVLFDEYGDLETSHYYVNGVLTDENFFYDMIPTNDGGYLFAGGYKVFHIADSTGNSNWLVKTDSLFNAPNRFTLSIEENNIILNQKLNIYPNPAQEHINLGFENMNSAKYNITIYDIKGSLIFSEDYSSNQTEFKINIDHLQSGQYILIVKGEKNELFREKFIKN